LDKVTAGKRERVCQFIELSTWSDPVIYVTMRTPGHASFHEVKLSFPAIQNRSNFKVVLTIELESKLDWMVVFSRSQKVDAVEYSCG